MRKLLLFAMLQFAGLLCYSQTKTSVGIIPFERSSNSRNRNESISNDEKTLIEDAITDAFIKAKHFTLVDRSNLNALDNERELQKSEAFINGATVEQGKSIGADYLIRLGLQDYKNDGVVCKFKLTLNVINVATGELRNTEIIDVHVGHQGTKVAAAFGTAAAGTMLSSRVPAASMLASNTSSAGSMVGSKQKALQKALNAVADEMDDFVAKKFPLTFTIVEIQKQDSNGAVKILIAGGMSSGLQRGDKLKAVYMKDMDVDGKKLTRTVFLADLTVSKVEDDNFSICLVNTVRNKIPAMLENGTKLKAIQTNENAD
ncbi:CsgG/HfaB family protein [Taibaiella soli]|uniref:Penicillin-binding protein activator LpoB n=1 Tax=Taibaiella soli TaxID=1649169 RepID=A0A2W2B8Q5_9BACT|nr:CsgG/HfaB family protein [Taibaiella soli]PZF72669.1 hypothetical protein DN068_12450 [Taibaiella soli]